MEIVAWFVVQIALFGGMMWLTGGRRRRQSVPNTMLAREESHETRELRGQRGKSLSVPLSELSRPVQLDDIVGQEDGINALKAAICGTNPQHVIIYGPPGVGKTCAARLVFAEAKNNEFSPFDADAKFIEMDATCIRFDERAIADPLIGSVHDPIYQGAGALGASGIPQPKPGAVSRAHCGILFLDEIGELHPMQMNKLLKVLEDRRVNFDSAYYSKDNAQIPGYIHDIFQNGLPADFRLIGATTRSPEEIPPALRSRCVELFFMPLAPCELVKIAANAAQRLGFKIEDEALEACALYSASGRDCVNIIQLAGEAARLKNRNEISHADVLWVAKTCRHARQNMGKLNKTARIGCCYGMAVSGSGAGHFLSIECCVFKSKNGGSLHLGGMVEDEELDARNRKLKRKATAFVSAKNVLYALKNRYGVDYFEYDISFNVPGGIPMDGPSAGIAMFVALYSAVFGVAPRPLVALTGEVTPFGAVLPVGGVREKLLAAIEAGATTLIIPKSNWEDSFSELGAEIICVEDVSEAVEVSFLKEIGVNSAIV